MQLTRRRGLTATAMSLAAVAMTIAALPATALGAGSLTVSTCGAGIFGHAAAFGINTTMNCPPVANPPTGVTILTGPNQVPAGRRATWQADAPAGLSIVGVSIPPNDMYSNGVNDGRGWGGGFYWVGGGAQTHDNEPTFASPPMNSSYFGFQIVCGASTCDGSVNPAQLTVESVNLQATESQGPALAASTGLWQSRGWVRGNWPLTFSGDSPSGVCAFYATVNTSLLTGPTSPQNPTVWHQCAAPAFAQTISTSAYGQGPVALTLAAIDAAGVAGSASRTIDVDNTLPSIALSGPQDASTTAGTQDVAATAVAGPSGVAGTSCSVDGGTAQWRPGARATIPVQGLGVHTVTCSSANNARDGSGNAGWSAPATWTLSIRQPTASAISFGTRIVDALQCRRATERVKVPAVWVTVRVHGRAVKVRIAAHTQTVKMVRCHPRVVRVRVRVLEHGRWRWRFERQVRLPRAVQRSAWRARFGAPSTVVGWLGTSSGVAIAGRAVRVLTAPDDGSRAFIQAAVATTGADGTWSARLPGGPSRFVQAVYDGDPGTEPSASAQIHVTAPASISLSVHPHQAHWGGRIVLSGRLAGGYLPAAGETVILSVHFGGRAHDFAHVSARGDGRFQYVYTFLPGNGTAAYPFSAETVRESDYPYTPSTSRRVTVDVSP